MHDIEYLSPIEYTPPRGGQRQSIDFICGMATSGDVSFTMQLPRGCLTLYTLCDTIILFCAERRFSPHRNDLTRPPVGGKKIRLQNGS